MSFKCPVCRSSEFEKKINCIDYTVSKESFDIVECKHCHLWQTYPAPDEKEISKYYESKEYISHSDKKETFFDKIYHLVRKYAVVQKTNLIKKYVSRGTIIDIGCGTGYFLENCKKNKFNVYGIEPNRMAREIANKKEIEVFENLNALIDKEIKAEIITLWHVLEHLYYPKDFLEHAYNNLLKEKGILILALPNHNSYDALYYKNFWAGYDVPRHVFHFTKNDVLNLTRQKFQLIEILPMYFDAFYVSILSEKYKQSSYPFLRGMIRGFASNLNAAKNNEYSSLIYVLQKN